MAGAGLRCWAAVAVLTAGFFQPARAEPPATSEQFKQAFALIIAPISVVEALTAQCDTVAPQSRASRQAMLKTWRDGNRIDAVERHFIARFGDDKADDPGSIYLGGEMLWDRDKEDKPAKKK